MRSPKNMMPRRRLASSVFALAGLRAPLSQHSKVESVLLRQYTASATTIVEIGVAEGASAWEARQAMPAHGHLYLIDPYHQSPFGRLSPSRLVAHRLVNTIQRARVTWIDEFSEAASSSWSIPIDLLFIDGNHQYEAVKTDWKLWTPHLSDSGHVALHDARIEAPWTVNDSGPVRLLREVREDPAWKIVGEADSLAVLRRV